MIHTASPTPPLFGFCMRKKNPMFFFSYTDSRKMCSLSLAQQPGLNYSVKTIDFTTPSLTYFTQEVKYEVKMYS